MLRAWDLIVGCLRLATDGELYMLIWLAVRGRFVSTPASEVEIPKAKAAGNGRL